MTCMATNGALCNSPGACELRSPEDQVYSGALLLARAGGTLELLFSVEPPVISSAVFVLTCGASHGSGRLPCWVDHACGHIIDSTRY